MSSSASEAPKLSAGGAVGAGDLDPPSVALALNGGVELVHLVELVESNLARAVADKTAVDFYLEQLGQGSRKTMREALDRIAHLASSGLCDRQSFPWGCLRYAHAQWIRSQLVTKYAPKTVNKMLAAFRGVLREAFLLGHFGKDGADDYMRARSIKNVRAERLRRGRMLNPGELRALFDVCDPSPAGRRDAALLTLLRQGGIRIFEAAALDIADYNPATGDLVVHRGKGDKERAGYVSGAGVEAIAAWLELRGDATGPLLCPVDRWGHITIRRMTTDGVRLAYSKRVREASLAPTTPHDMRRTFISELISVADLSTAQRLAGHARADETAGYDVRPEATRRRAAESLHVPFRR